MRTDEMIGSEGERCIFHQLGKRYDGVVESVEGGGWFALVRIDGSERIVRVGSESVELVDSEDEVLA